MIIALGVGVSGACNKKARNGTGTLGDGGGGDAGPTDVSVADTGGGLDAVPDTSSVSDAVSVPDTSSVPDVAADVGPRDVAFERVQYADGGPVGGRAFDDCTQCDPVGSFNPTVVFCGANDTCPEMMSCFHVAADIATCAFSYRDDTTCGNGMSSHADDCGCNGLTCPANKTCIGAVDNDGSLGTYNTCVDKPCASASECVGGLACTPGTFIRAPGHPTPRPGVGRCFQPLCWTDADCTDGDSGRCAIALHNTGTGGLEFGVRCVYHNIGTPPGVPDPSWCAGTTVRLVRRLPQVFDAAYHICPDLAR